MSTRDANEHSPNRSKITVRKPINPVNFSMYDIILHNSLTFIVIIIICGSFHEIYHHFYNFCSLSLIISIPLIANNDTDIQNCLLEC